MCVTQGLSHVPSAISRDESPSPPHDERASHHSDELATDSEPLADEFSDCVDSSDVQDWESASDLVRESSCRLSCAIGKTNVQ